MADQIDNTRAANKKIRIGLEGITDTSFRMTTSSIIYSQGGFEVPVAPFIIVPRHELDKISI